MDAVITNLFFSSGAMKTSCGFSHPPFHFMATASPPHSCQKLRQSLFVITVPHKCHPKPTNSRHIHTPNFSVCHQSFKVCMLFQIDPTISIFYITIISICINFIEFYLQINGEALLTRDIDP